MGGGDALRTRLERADWTQLLSQVWESQAALFCSIMDLGGTEEMVLCGRGDLSTGI